MINRQAVRHRPLSEFAYAPAEYCLTIRLQAARNNLKRCTLFYGDRVDPHPQVRFRPQNMEKVATLSEAQIMLKPYSSWTRDLCRLYCVLYCGQL